MVTQTWLAVLGHFGMDGDDAALEVAVDPPANGLARRPAGSGCPW